MQLDGHRAIVVIGDLHALAHGLGAQQVDKAVRHGAVGHALDAEAVGGGGAGNGGEHRVGDGDIPVLTVDLYHSSLPFYWRCVHIMA